MANLGTQNPLARSAQSFILSSLRLVGALRSGQNLSGGELSDCLQVLNDLLDAWNSQRITIFVTPRITLDQNQAVLSLLANQATYSLGNSLGTENFLLPRPPRLERVSVMYSASQQTPVELPMDMYNTVRWQRVPNKSTPSLLPQVCYIEPNFPDMSLTFWPIPTQSNPVVLYPWQALQQFPDLTQAFSFPPGYARAIRFNLAVDLAAEFPCDLQKFPLVRDNARIYKSEIASVNVSAREGYCDPALLGDGGTTRGNIYTGGSSRTGNV